MSLGWGTVWAGPGDHNSLNWALLTIGGVSKGAIVDSGGFTSISYVDAIAMGILNSDGSPKITPNPPTANDNINGVACNVFTVSTSFKPATNDGAGHLSANGTSETSNLTFKVPKSSDPNRGRVPTKLGRDVVGVAFNGRRLVPWDFGGALTSNGNVVNLRGSKWADAGPPLPADIQFPLSQLEPPGIAGVSVNGVSTFADLSFLPTTMISPVFAQSIGFISSSLFTPDSDLANSLFADGYVSDPTAISFESGFADIVIPSLTGPYKIAEVAVDVNPELTVPVVLGGDALLPTYKGGYLTSTEYIITSIPEPCTLLLSAIAVCLVVGPLRSRRANVRAPS
jgi:hypothetical protein